MAIAVEVTQFSARDAFLYTDTYRKAIKLSAATIATEKEHLKERVRSSGNADSSYFAEMRALEHAMNYVVKGDKPGQVVLGELERSGEGAEAREARLNGRVTELQSVLSKEKADKERLKKDLKKVGDAYAKLQAKAMELSQQVARLQRKVVQTSSTFGVVGFSLFVVIVVLLLVLAKN